MADGLSVASGVAGIISLGIQVTKSLVDFYAAYKSQKSDIARTTKKLDHLLNVLDILRKQSTNRKFRADEEDLLNNIEASIQACEEIIGELQRETEKFKKTSVDGIRAAARTASHQLAYPFRQSTLQKLDEDIDEICVHLTLALQVLQQNDIGNVQDDIEDTKKLLSLVRASQISSIIRNWLKAPDVTINYNAASKKKHPGTGIWLVKGSVFTAWLTKPNSFLWLNGFAGCGKSVLCSTAIQYAFRHRRSNPRTGIAFFFFTFNDDSKQDTSAMLRALVLQLSSQLKDNHALLSRFHEKYHNTMPPDQALLDCLLQLIQEFEDVYIILDALDESPPHKYREDVLQALDDLRKGSEPGLHLLVTSRDENDIRDDLDPARDETIPMKNESVDRDIAVFVSGYLKDNRRLRKWEEYHDQIETALTERAKGVFRWVECQFTALESCPRSKRHLDGLLASLPRSLDKTYERMLLRIDEESMEDAKRILTLLCYSKRPLTVQELIEAIAVELGDSPRLNTDGRLRDEDDIRQVCPGLVEVDVKPGLETATVRIAHYSVQEYLESERISQQAAKFSVKRSEAHTDIARICLAYLLEPALSMANSSIEEYPLTVYAAVSWHDHYHDGNKTAQQLEFLVLRLFRDTEGAFEHWLKIWQTKRSRGRVFDGASSPTYYASLLGLDSVLSELLSDRSSNGLFSVPNILEISDLVNAQGGKYRNALQAASAGGHEKVIQILLGKNADINAQGGVYGNALQAASAGGHEKVVQALLDKNADINAQGGEYRNALQAASAGGHEKVVQKLLDKNADINAQGGHYGNALQAASAEGHDKVVQILLDKNADINAQGGHYGNALQLASARGHEKVVQALLDKNADINAQGGHYGNALQVASARGHEKVVQILLGKNADINAQGGEYGNALQAASAGGHDKVVQALLDKNADINAQGGHYGNALQVASARGHEKVVQALLDKNADINAQGGVYANALQAASAGGHEKVVQALFDKNADINAQGGYYGSALQAASAKGHEKVVQILLDNTNINTQGGDYGNALHVASVGGHEKVVQMLLDKNPNQDEYYNGIEALRYFFGVFITCVGTAG